MNKQLSHSESNHLQKKFPLTLVADGLQGPANIGSLFRVSEAFGIEKIYFCNSIINFGSARLKKTAILSFFPIYKLFNKPAADGKVTKAAIEEYLEYIDDEKDAIIERCQKIWR